VPQVIEIMVTEIRNKLHPVHDGKARLGITADRSVSIHRQEVYDAIQREAITEPTDRTA